MGEPKRYGLIIPNKKAANKPVKKLAVFGNDSSDDEETAHKEVNLSLIQEAQKKRQMKQTQIEIQKALKDDPTVYEYDAVYDEMEEKKKAVNVKVPEKDRKPKYIAGLLKSAAARKRDYERTVERQVQKEREKEQGEFDDKEAFVTEAFRRKMQEQAEEEERLKRQDAIDAANDVTKQKDLSLFYRNLLDRNVSLGGSFTGEDATKKDLQNKERHGRSEQEDKKSSQENLDERKHEEYRNKEGKKHSIVDEEMRRHPRSPVRHSREHDHSSRNRRDSEGHEEHRRRSLDSSDKERRRHSGRNFEDRESQRHPSHSERHRSSRDDRRHSENSERSRTKHDDRRDRVRKREHREEEDHEVDNGSVAERDENESAKIVRESKKAEETLSKESLSKFAKRSTGETVLSAKERYLARKRARDAANDATRNPDDSDD